MGWLYMKSLKGHSGPRQYLDAQFTYERPDMISKVLRSALVGMRVYYAAVEQVRIATGAARGLGRHLPRPIQSARPRGLHLRLQGHGRVDGAV